MNNEKIKVGITHGDTNGIGYEVILKLLEDVRLADLCTIVLYGSAKAAGFYRKGMDLPQVQFTRIDSAADARDGVFYIINVVGEDLKIDPGTGTDSVEGSHDSVRRQAACSPPYHPYTYRKGGSVGHERSYCGAP